MPFKSKAQMRAAFGGYLGPEMKNRAETWAHETSNIKSLPMHVNKLHAKHSKELAQLHAKHGSEMQKLHARHAKEMGAMGAEPAHHHSDGAALHRKFEGAAEKHLFGSQHSR